MNRYGQSWLIRWQLNFDPGYRRSGGRISFLSGDMKHARLTIRPGRTRCSAVRHVTPPCLCSVIDPLFLLMLAHNLDAGCLFDNLDSCIRQLKPMRDPLNVDLVLDNQTLAGLRSELAAGRDVLLVREFEFYDSGGGHSATLQKRLNISPSPTLH